MGAFVSKGVRDVWGRCSCLKLFPGFATVRNSQILTTTVLNSSQPDSDKTSCLNRSRTDCLSFSYSVRKDEVSYSIYGKRAFLFCHNVWPSCCVTTSQFCPSRWWCWRNSPCIRQGRCVDACSIAFNGLWGGRKSEIFICAKQFLRPHQSSACGTSHACHTLDTPLTGGTAAIGKPKRHVRKASHYGSKQQ